MKYPYADLELERSATVAEIKQRYRSLVKELHSDVNNPDTITEQRIRKVIEAYELLSDPDRRAMYDCFAERWQSHPEQVWEISATELEGKTAHYLWAFKEMRELFDPYLPVKVVFRKRSWRRLWRR